MTVWTPLTRPEDKIKIAKRLTPGICDIEGLGSPREWEERGGYGLSGATVVFKGKKLAHFTIKFRLYTAQDWADWDAFRPLVMRLPIGKNAKGLDIQSKLTESVGVRSIVIEDPMAPTQTGDGEWTVELKVIEFRAPTFALSKPEGSEATPVDPNEQQIEANRIWIKNKKNAMSRPNNGRKQNVVAPP
jgi:hypothetical protein